MLAAYLRDRGYSVLEQPLDQTERIERHRRGRASRASCSPRTSTACRRFSRAGSKATCSTAVARATRRAFSRRRWPRPSGCGPRGETRVGLVFVAGEERGSDGAMAANQIASQSKFLINGEPTDNRLGRGDARGLSRPAERRGRAAHSGYPELGESAIEKLLDVLVAMRTARGQMTTLLGTHALHGRSHLRRRGSQRRPAARRGGGFLPHAWARTTKFARILRRRRRRPRRDRRSARGAAGAPANPCRLRVPRSSPTRPIFRFCQLGDAAPARPGSIHVAHTDHEHVSIDELRRGCRSIREAREAACWTRVEYGVCAAPFALRTVRHLVLSFSTMAQHRRHLRHDRHCQAPILIDSPFVLRTRPPRLAGRTAVRNLCNPHGPRTASGPEGSSAKRRQGCAQALRAAVGPGGSSQFKFKVQSGSRCAVQRTDR